MAFVPAHRPGRVAVLARLGVAMALVATLGAGSASQPRDAEAGLAPRCGYADTLTRYRGTADWYRSLLDTRYRLSRAYAPSDLVPANRSGASGRGSIRRIALADLTAMYRAARAAGAPFAIQSAYRSYANQVATFNRWVMEDGYASAILGSARPGHSEHQLGTALDLKTPGGPEPWDVADWATTRAGSWLARNSWRYGFIVSYPKAKSPGATCYRYEPWHVRYFGRTIASKIHRSSLAARQWLYLKGATTTWTGGSPNPTPAPTPTPTPSLSPTPPPSADPADAPSALPTDEPASPSVDPSPSGNPSPSVEPSPPAEPSPTDGASPSADVSVP
jgi:D-alanyl-D-alanine carboxypeptidase